MAVLVLEPFAVHRRPPGGAPEQEAPPPAVRRGPQQVAHPLESEHRVEEVEGNHRLAQVAYEVAAAVNAAIAPASVIPSSRICPDSLSA